MINYTTFLASAMKRVTGMRAVLMMSATADTFGLVHSLRAIDAAMWRSAAVRKDLTFIIGHVARWGSQ